MSIYSSTDIVLDKPFDGKPSGALVLLSSLHYEIDSEIEIRFRNSDGSETYHLSPEVNPVFASIVKHDKDGRTAIGDVKAWAASGGRSFVGFRFYHGLWPDWKEWFEAAKALFLLADTQLASQTAGTALGNVTLDDVNTALDQVLSIIDPDHYAFDYRVNGKRTVYNVKKDGAFVAQMVVEPDQNDLPIVKPIVRVADDFMGEWLRYAKFIMQDIERILGNRAQPTQPSAQQVSVEVGGGYAVVGYDDNPVIQALIAGEPLPQVKVREVEEQRMKDWGEMPFIAFDWPSIRSSCDDLFGNESKPGVIPMWLSNYRQAHPNDFDLAFERRGYLAYIRADGSYLPVMFEASEDTVAGNVHLIVKVGGNSEDVAYSHEMYKATHDLGLALGDYLILRSQRSFDCAADTHSERNAVKSKNVSAAPLRMRAQGE